MVKPSTVVELAGFACLDVAAFRWTLIAGLVTTGFSLLLVGYATEDTTAVVTVTRMLEPLRRRRASFKARQARRRKRRDERRSSRWHRQPAEIALTVRTD